MLDRNDGRMDAELFRMAAQETISVPDSLNQKLDAIMEELPDNTRWHMNWKKTILLTAAAGALQQRKEVTEIDTGTYDCNRLGGLCLGKDGRIYTQIQSMEGDKQIQGIAAVNREKGCLSDCYVGIVPEDTIMLDIVAPGTDTDFVFWGFDGIFTYNLGEESAIHFLPAYEALCQWEGVLNCALPDGRIVFGACSEYRQEVREDGTERFYRIPEKVCFYVIRTSS